MSAASAFVRRLALPSVLVLALIAAVRLQGYALIGASLRSGNFSLSLQLDATAPSGTMPLLDGSTSWNEVAQAAAEEWNGATVRTKLTWTSSASAAAQMRDGVNSVLFATKLFDRDFGSGTLAITYVDIADDDLTLPTVQTREIDLLVNKAAYTWNSYRGNLRSGTQELRRVVLHELGHALGLDHPDQALPVQNVAAIMNSSVSNRETLQTDDRNGAAYLYGTALVAPAFTQQPASQTVSVGGTAELTFTMNGATPPPAADGLLSYTWYFKGPGATEFEPLFTLETPALPFGSAQPADAGSYYVVVMTPDTKITSSTVTLTVTPVTTTPTTALLNLSTRGLTSATSPMTVGLSIGGTRAKTILVRAIGPTLGSFGVAGTLPDPKLTLIRQSDSSTVATSRAIWDENAAEAETIRNTSARVYAFPLAAGTRDAVILASVQPGTYTAMTTSPSGASGVVLVEAYDADTTQDLPNRFLNLSSRGYVSTGANVLIAGFSVAGPGPRTYLIRVAAKALEPPPFNVPGTLDDPILKLYRTANGSVLLRELDDWDSPASSQPALQAAFQKVYAFPFAERQETAMLVTLPPGTYTAEASGNPNGGTSSPSGNAIIEIYEMPE